MFNDTHSCNKSRSSFTEIDTFGSSLTSAHRHHNLSRPNSVVSLGGLDLPQSHEEGIAGPFSNLIHILKGGSLFNFFILSLLLYATINDLTSRVTSKTPHYSYNHDELSGEAIYPIYSTRGDLPDGQSRSNKSHSKRNKGLLGSAMIQSITEALSPILPFAGGVDLRRDENWKSWSSWLTLWDGRFDSATKRHSSNVNVDQVTAVPRGGHFGSRADSSKNTKKTGHSFETKATLSTTDPFLSTDDISEMTLEEVSLMFHYAVLSGDENINAVEFLKQNVSNEVDSRRLTKAIQAIDDAVGQSRGKGVQEAITLHAENYNEEGPLSEVNGYGDLDALKFCAAMRILAEWRVLRQVPPGYKGYAVGMNLGHKDVVQNIGKIETAIHEWIENRSEVELINRVERDCDEESNCADNILHPRSPTLRELLQFEVDSDVHPTSKLPRLKEKTAAMGLLWVRRQLHYQTAIFKNIISVPETYPTVIGAVGAAYSEVYGQLHGWTVQKIFNYSFQSAPDADLIFRHMNPRKLEQIEKLRMNSNNIESNIITTNSMIMADNSFIATGAYPEQNEKMRDHDEGNPIQNFFSHVGADIDRFFVETGSHVQNIGNQITTEWDKTVDNIGKIFNHNKDLDNDQSKQPINTRGGSSSNKTKATNVSIKNEEIETIISKEMAANARQHILTYLDVAVPLLNDLAGLFKEMNMDDPTKV